MDIVGGHFIEGKKEGRKGRMKRGKEGTGKLSTFNLKIKILRNSKVGNIPVPSVSEKEFLTYNFMLNFFH